MKPKLLRSEEDRAYVLEALQEFYATRPDGYGKGINQEKWDKYADLVKRYTKAGGRVLDIGSGSWRIPYTIFKRGFDVDGCDIWPEDYLAQQLREMPKDGPHLIRYNGEILPYPDETFNTVCSLTVFEHLLDVAGMLYEIDRVLLPGGINIILTPNCAGPHVPIRAMFDLLINNDRRWRYDTIQGAITGIVHNILIPFKISLSTEAIFLYIFPRMKYGKIDFVRTDDDVVHLSCPSSYKKWFKLKGYRLLKYNRGEGKSTFARCFNSIFPFYATEVCIVAQKPF
jgi:SAM-dependent methyltransferase